MSALDRVARGEHFGEPYRVDEVWITGDKVECSDCDWKGKPAALSPIGVCALTAGDPSPAGRCPECGALAYVPTGDA